jgi:threonyl-tRNA synthetase
MSDEIPAGDHRRIGRELDLFHLQEEASGSVFWHERGHTLFRTVENYIRTRLANAGYGEVKTPQLYSQSLFKASGHMDMYGDAIFQTGGAFIPEEIRYNPMGPDDPGITTVKGDPLVHPTHALKPMNCPGHVQIFKADTVSYRQLPWRMAEFGCCHRNEPSGSIHGIMRVRQFTQDDAHIFCTEEQVAEETKAFCELLLSVYRDFGFTDIEIGFSTRPDVRAGTDEVWDKAEEALATAVKAAGLIYKLQPGEGAFYGPKLEFALLDNRGRRWQCGTIQLDFVLPKRLGAEYVGPDNVERQPVMLHRAILGSLERFIGILLENYEGKLPAWLAPQQVVVVSIKPETNDYAKEVFETLKGMWVRPILDIRDENVSQKIKEHSEMAIPYIVAVGPRDEDNRTIAIRKLGDKKPTDYELFEGCGMIEEDCFPMELRKHNW